MAVSRCVSPCQCHLMKQSPPSFRRRFRSAVEKGCFRPTTMPTASGLGPGAGGNEEAPSRAWGDNARSDTRISLWGPPADLGSFRGRRSFSFNLGVKP